MILSPVIIDDVQNHSVWNQTFAKTFEWFRNCKTSCVYQFIQALTQEAKFGNHVCEASFPNKSVVKNV